MRTFESSVFFAENGFGGNGPFVEATPEQNPLNITGHTGGGCVSDGPFVSSAFMLNFPDPKLVQNVLDQPDYTSFAYAVEGTPSFAARNIHGSAHFGVGGVLGTCGNAANSPGDPIFYLHHGNLDRIFWEWQQKDLETRLNQVGGPVVPFDYGGANVTLDFTINMGKLAGDATLESLLDTTGGTLCYTY
jgi:tyrosinase